MLTITLRALERDGLVTRTIYPQIPPRVDYEVTELGRALIEPVLLLATGLRHVRIRSSPTAPSMIGRPRRFRKTARTRRCDGW
jgi:DNA-binding HxlR family transcriptional regulator